METRENAVVAAAAIPAVQDACRVLLEMGVEARVVLAHDGPRVQVELNEEEADELIHALAEANEPA